MKINIIKVLFLAFIFIGIGNVAEAQKGKKKTSQKRPSTTVTTKNKTKADVKKSSPTEDTAIVAKEKDKVIEAQEKTIDTLPIKEPKKSWFPDEAVETQVLSDRAPLVYEHLRAEDAVYRHRIWREIDTREKMNQAFNYDANGNNGNQRFISILFKALKDTTNNILAFDNIDDRFTTPLNRSDLVRIIAGSKFLPDVFDADGKKLPPGDSIYNEINLDSFYRFQIKEEVIFDKESSRLFWRILGIAPVKNIITTSGIDQGSSPLFWLYYPQLRPILAKYEVFNGKNYGNRMSWEELFESRMFSGRIIKSSMDNPKDIYIKDPRYFIPNPLHQLFEGETIKEKIFTYEQDQWSY
jgi:gliding motility associated protien GldN